MSCLGCCLLCASFTYIALRRALLQDVVYGEPSTRRFLVFVLLCLCHPLCPGLPVPAGSGVLELTICKRHELLHLAGAADGGTGAGRPGTSPSPESCRARSGRPTRSLFQYRMFWLGTSCLCVKIMMGGKLDSVKRVKQALRQNCSAYRLPHGVAAFESGPDQQPVRRIKANRLNSILSTFAFSIEFYTYV